MKKLYIALIGVGLVALFWAGSTIVGWRNGMIEAGLRVDSLEAAADTTRLVHEGEVLVFERRAIQAGLRVDSLDERLQVESRARAGLAVQVRKVDTVFAGTTTVDQGTDVRTITIDQYVEPYTIALEADVPPPPMAASVRFRIQLDSIPIGVRLSCGTQGEDQIIPALVQATAPPWARVSISDVVQEPGICNPVTFDIPTPSSLLGDVMRPVLIGGFVFGGLKLLGVL